MIRILKSSDGKFYYVVVANNRKVIATSEKFARKCNCLDGARSLVKVLRRAHKIEDRT